MNERMERALEDSLDLLARGLSLDACLARYPDKAEDLTPLLSLAQVIQGLTPSQPLSASKVAQERKRFLQEAARLRAERSTSRGWLGRLSLPARTALATPAVLALTLVIGAGAVLAAGGDLSSAIISLFPEPVQEVLGIERETVEIDFTGNIEVMSDSSWVISGQVVLIDANTVIDGTPALGAKVEVHALVQPDGSLLAASIHVQEVPLVAIPDFTDESEESEILLDKAEVIHGEIDEDEAHEDEDQDSGDGGNENGEEVDEDQEEDEPEEEATAGTAAAAIAAAEQAILDAQVAIDAAAEGIDTSSAQEKVDEAWEKFAEAEALLEEGDYAAVLDTAEDVQQLAEDARDALADAAEDGEEGADIEGDNSDSETDSDGDNSGSGSAE